MSLAEGLIDVYTTSEIGDSCRLYWKDAKMINAECCHGEDGILKSGMGEATEVAKSIRGIAQPGVAEKEQLGHLQRNGAGVLRQEKKGRCMKGKVRGKMLPRRQ